MSSFEITGGQIVITNGSRVVATTGGTLLQFLTGAVSYSASLVFPDASKGWLYQWQYGITRAPGDNFSATRAARSAVGAKPQEWANTVILAAAPAGADLFVGRAILTRTVAPSHTWLTQNISPMVPQGVAIQVNGGSMIVEAAIGISRSLTVDVEGGNLVAKLEQSVGPAAGNFGTQGTVPAASPTSITPPHHFNSGSENIAVGGVAGFPVWWNDVYPYYLSDGRAFSGILGGGSAAYFANSLRYGGDASLSYTDPTNYSSTYSITVSGRFGRRS